MSFNNPTAASLAQRAESLASRARTNAIHEDYDDGIKKLAEAVADLAKAIKSLAS